MLSLFLSLLPGCAARHMPDWSRGQAVPPQTKIEVQLYKDKAPQGSRKIKGHLHSVTTDSITLKLKDGQARTLEKSAARKVLTRRPFSKRLPGWVALGVTFGVLQTLLSMSASVDNVSASTMAGAHAAITLPITAAFFYGSRMGGIYEVPLQHRTRPTGGQQSGVEVKSPGKPEDHPRRD